MQVNTRGGVFGPGGYGGGVFDGSQMGFGGLGALGAGYEQAAAGLMGMGQDPSQDLLQTPEFAAGTAFHWDPRGTGPSDPRVLRLQVALNKELKARSFLPIGTDGKLGPRTCGAIAWVGTVHPDFDANPDLYLMEHIVDAATQNVCVTSTYPTKVGGGVFKPPNVFHAGLPWGVFDAQTQTVQKNLNVDLEGHGYLPIGTDGKLDAPTCGAMKLASDSWGMDYFGEFGGNCQAFQAPTKKAPPAPPPPGPLPPGPTPGPTPHPTTKASMTGWVVGGLLGAAALAGVYAMRKK